jgi:hypothetical protein
MTKKDYADVLRFAIQAQIEYQKEEIQKPYADEQFHSGVIEGLRIALDKIDASMFLAEKE